MKSKLLLSVCLLGLAHEASAMFGRGKQQPAPTAPRPVAPAQQPAAQVPDLTATRRAEDMRRAEEARKADEANQLKQAREMDAQRAAEEARAAAAAKGKRPVAELAAGRPQDDIAGAAYIKLRNAGYDAAKLEAAAAKPGAQQLANMVGQGQQSHMLGRLGKPAKKDKHSKRYAH